MTMLDDDDRAVLRFLYKKSLTKDGKHGRTPNMLASGVTCIALSADAAVRHLGYAISTAVAGRTHDGSPVHRTVVIHTRKSVLHLILAVTGLAVTAVYGPVWIFRCAIARLTPPPPRPPDGTTTAEQHAGTASTGTAPVPDDANQRNH